jgi:hypothetical protein
MNAFNTICRTKGECIVFVFHEHVDHKQENNMKSRFPRIKGRRTA